MKILIKRLKYVKTWKDFKLYLKYEIKPILRVRVDFSKGINRERQKGWVFALHLGRSAGYIYGRTLFIAYRSEWQVHKKRFQGITYPDLYYGFTINANIVPYGFF